MAFDPQEVSAPGAKIKVVGVGGGGTNAVSTMIRSNIEGVEFVAANTDVQSLRFALAPNKIQIGKELTKGLGAGADPDIGRDAALEDRHELQETLGGSDMVFVTAGMGGGTGTGGASIVSQIARENGALTVGVVTKPFSFEGKRRRKHAELGIARLKEHVDTLVVIPNDRLLKIATPDLSMLEAFKMADTVLVNAVRGISDIINIPGTINVDFADVKTVMSSMGHALMGIGTATGENRAKEAAYQAISSPLLEDVDIEGATGILINITAGEKISLVEINEACSIIEDAAHEDANIIFGAVIDENMKDSIRITVIATGFPTAEDEDFMVSEREEKSSSYYRRNTRPGATSKMANTPREMSFNSILNEAKEEKISTPMPKQETTLEEPQKEEIDDHHSMSHIDDSDLARFTLDQVAQSSQPGVEDTIKEENPKDEPEINLASNTPSEAENAIETKAQGEPIEDQASKLVNENTEPMESPSTVSKSPKFPTDPDDEFFLDDGSQLTDDIDRRIDEALELAEKVRSLDSKEDDLDVPAFLRNNHKDINLT
ncbi:MAG: cell division protein FtsZ [Oligoflexales bacterium]|nr:cell division protein FtsZ [Oligoflexales bacterium]